ncbi:hypothetical protein AAMO2058_000650900 [Amorphochlora amoebiformis]
MRASHEKPLHRVVVAGGELHMPLKRSKSSKNLTLACTMGKKRHSESVFENVRLSDFRSRTYPLLRAKRTKRGRVSPIEEEKSQEPVFTCAGCQGEQLEMGFYMYLDQCFCSEECRSEAITMDEIRFLRLA